MVRIIYDVKHSKVGYIFISNRAIPDWNDYAKESVDGSGIWGKGRRKEGKLGAFIVKHDIQTPIGYMKIVKHLWLNEGVKWTAG